MKPLLKWPGGKEHEVSFLRHHHPGILPDGVADYYEPFLGGGACFLATRAERYHLNDACQDLISFYRLVQARSPDFFATVERMGWEWKSILPPEGDPIPWAEAHGCLPAARKKLASTLPPEDLPKNLEAAAKAAYYTRVRARYNAGSAVPHERAADFYFLREFSYTAMFRFNRQGHFNVPYGGISYNHRSPADRLVYWKSGDLHDRLAAASFHCGDFADHIGDRPNDFNFLDPPYDSAFSTYQGHPFTAEDHRRLAARLRPCKARWLLVVKDTPLMAELYRGWSRIVEFDKTYRANFKNRNSRSAVHLAVTNF